MCTHDRSQFRDKKGAFRKYMHDFFREKGHFDDYVLAVLKKGTLLSDLQKCKILIIFLAYYTHEAIPLIKTS